MKRLWKDFRTNLMYWRFRHITRNRLRLQSWYRRQQPIAPYRPRASAYVVYRRNSRKTWVTLLATVAVLTALRVASAQASVSPTLIYLCSLLVIVGAIYWAMRNT